MSDHHDIYRNSDPPYSSTYYAYKSKLYFRRNAMMMIFCSLVKIITTHTHTHTHTHTTHTHTHTERRAHMKKKRKKFFFTWSICHYFGYTSCLIHLKDNFKFAARSMCLHTHTYKISLICPHTMISNYTPPHTHTKSCTRF